MAQTKFFKLGVPELAGTGFASGVLGGAVASLAGCDFDTAVPYGAAFGTVALPVFWWRLRQAVAPDRPPAQHA